MADRPKPPMVSQCPSCIFRPGQTVIRPGRLAEIQGYLIQGTPHTCHTNPRRACRGGRDYQLMIWARLGIIDEPTDASLAEAMAAVGFDSAPILPTAEQPDANQGG